MKISLPQDRHRLIRTGLTALAAAAALAPATFAWGAEPVNVRVAWIVPVANIASILAEKKGIAIHEGKSYTMEAIHFQGTPPMITALATGDLEIGLLGFSSLPLGVENANMTDLRIIADEIRDGVPGYYSNEFMVRSDGPVKTAADLKGKVLATNAYGSAVDIAMRALLKRGGVDAKSDVTIIESSFPNMKAMLLEKKVDLIPAVLPFSQDPALRAATRTIAVQRDALGANELGIWVARASFLEKHRAAMVDLMEDYLRLSRWFVDPKNHDEAVALSAKFTKRPPQIFQDWLFTKKDYYRDPDGLPDIEGLQKDIDIQQELGFIKTRIDARKYVDLSIVKEAAARLK
jgi:sulfonate transport system substrate-binding protein